MGNISAEQHNMTRRAAKLKRKKTAKNQHAVEPLSPLRMAIRDREAQAKREAAKRSNEKRLLTKLNMMGVLQFSCDAYALDDDHMKYFRRNVRDIQDAIKALPYEQRRLYRWQHSSEEELDATGVHTFIVAIKR